MVTAVVVDTMIASAWLGLRASERKARWQALLERSAWVLPFTVVAEMRFGARSLAGVRDDEECSTASSPVPVSCLPWTR